MLRRGDCTAETTREPLSKPEHRRAWEIRPHITGGLTVHRPSPDNLPGMIPEIDIWRVANLMLQRYGDEADIESAIRAEEFAEAGDWAGGLLMLSGS